MRIVVARMPASCGAAPCLDPRFPESSPPRRPFRFHVPENAYPENTWPQHIWPERIKAARRTQRRTLRPPGGMRSGVQACRRRFVRRSLRRCGPGFIHRHHSRFPPSVIVSAGGRRDRSPVRAPIIGPRLVARFPARTGADILDNSRHDNSRHKVTRAGTSRNGGQRRANRYPFSFPVAPALRAITAPRNQSAPAAMRERRAPCARHAPGPSFTASPAFQFIAAASRRPAPLHTCRPGPPRAACRQTRSG